MSLARFYWVLLGFSGFGCFLGFLRFYKVLLLATGFYWVLLGFTGFYLVLLGFTGVYWVLLKFYLVLPSSTWFYLVSWVLLGLHLAVEGFSF